MKKLHFIPLLACLLCTVLSCTVIQEEPQGQEPEEPRQDAILNLVEVTENMFGIDLKNTVSVRGVQFSWNLILLVTALSPHFENVVIRYRTIV